MTWRQELDALELGQRVADAFSAQALADEIGALRDLYITTHVARAFDRAGTTTHGQVAAWADEAASRWDAAHPHLCAHWRRHRVGGAAA